MPNIYLLRQLQKHLPAVLSALLAFGLLIPSTGLSAESVGRIITIQGKPDIERTDGTTNKIKRDDPVFVGDIVRTGNGRAKILFEDNSIMTLGEETELKITAFLFEPKQEQRTSMFDLFSGKVKTLVGKLFSSAPDFKVRTPTAVAGVRGTFFQVDFDGDTNVTVFEGQVDVEDASGAILELLGGNQLSVGTAGFNGGVIQLTPDQLSDKQNEVSVRLEELLNQDAGKKVDNRGLAQRAVDGLDPLGGSGPPSGIGNQTGGNQAPDPLNNLEPADPANTGNVDLEFRFIPEKE